MEYSFELLCKKLNLGLMKEKAIQIFGGKTNKMYKIITTKGKYAIKVLSKSNVEKNENLLKKIETTEFISNYAKQNNISVICAKKYNGTYIQKIDGNFFLIYDWYEGDMLYNHKIINKNISDIALELAKFHKLRVPDDMEISYNNEIFLKDYIKLLESKNEDWSMYILKKYNKFIDIYNHSFKCYKELSKSKSFIHGDLSLKNILLVQEKVYFIDWETAKVANPSSDFFYTSWFGIGDFQEDNYYNFAKTYLKYNKLSDDINISSYAALTEEFAWFELCIKRALRIQTKDPYEIEIGKDSAIRCLDRILNCYDKIPDMLKIIDRVMHEKDVDKNI